MIRLIAATDHQAARIVIGQVLTEVSVRHRRATDLGRLASVLDRIVDAAMDRNALDVVVELDWIGDDPVITVADTAAIVDSTEAGVRPLGPHRPLGATHLLRSDTIRMTDRPDDRCAIRVEVDHGFDPFATQVAQADIEHAESPRTT